jgi:hypothetical protein
VHHLVRVIRCRISDRRGTGGTWGLAPTMIISPDASLRPCQAQRMPPNRYRGPPMTLGNMRENGMRSLAVYCWACHHQAVLAVDA